MTFKTGRIFFTNWMNVSFQNSVFFSLKQCSKECLYDLVQRASTAPDMNDLIFNDCTKTIGTKQPCSVLLLCVVVVVVVFTSLPLGR